MLQIGDLTIYQEHGICRVDDIQEMTFGGKTRTYYILHPIDNHEKLTLNVPVDNVHNILHELIDQNKAKKILETFRTEGTEWIEKPQQRTRRYEAIINSGDRIEIAKVASTLIRKKWEIEKDGRKFFENDQKLLTNIQNILFKEISIVLDTTVEDVTEKVIDILKAS